MEKFDVKNFVEWSRVNSENKAVFCEYVIEAMNKLDVSFELKQRPHTFVDGDEGEICDELSITIKFPKDLVIQPHDDYANGIVEATLHEVADEFYGYLDSQSSEGVRNNLTGQPKGRDMKKQSIEFECISIGEISSIAGDRSIWKKGHDSSHTVLRVSIFEANIDDILKDIDRDYILDYFDIKERLD